MDSVANSKLRQKINIVIKLSCHCGCTAHVIITLTSTATVPLQCCYTHICKKQYCHSAVTVLTIYPKTARLQSYFEPEFSRWLSGFLEKRILGSLPGCRFGTVLLIFFNNLINVF